MSVNNLNQKYEQYKKIDEDWLDVVPEHWEFRRVKTFLRLVAEPAPKNNDFELLSVYTDIGVRPRKELEEKGNKASTTDGYWLVQEGDFIVNKLLAWMGAVGISNYSGVTSPAYDILRPRENIAGNFYHYMFRMNTFSAVMKKSSRGIMDMRLRLYFDKFGDIRVPFPPYKEQLEIAKFLDKKTEQIDEAIAIKEKQIALLKERKQIITQQAVTQGLDPNVPMKDSGVEWIGRIPKHWHYEPIKYSLKGIVDCEHKTAPFVDEEEFFVVRTTNVKDGKINLTGAKYTHAKGYKEWTRRGIPTPGDILLTREAPAGEACTVPEDLKLCLGQRMVWLKVDRTRLVPEFGVALIYSSIGRTYIDFLSAGSTVLHFNMSDIANIPVVLPPLDEQKALVEYINCKSVEIENSSKILSQQIEKLREYKTTLINSAVTGKIKVA